MNNGADSQRGDAALIETGTCHVGAVEGARHIGSEAGAAEQINTKHVVRAGYRFSPSRRKHGVLDDRKSPLSPPSVSFSCAKDATYGSRETLSSPSRAQHKASLPNGACMQTSSSPSGGPSLHASSSPNGISVQAFSPTVGPQSLGKSPFQGRKTGRLYEIRNSSPLSNMLNTSWGPHERKRLSCVEYCDYCKWRSLSWRDFACRQPSDVLSYWANINVVETLIVFTL